MAPTTQNLQKDHMDPKNPCRDLACVGCYPGNPWFLPSEPEDNRPEITRRAIPRTSKALAELAKQEWESDPDNGWSGRGY